MLGLGVVGAGEGAKGLGYKMGDGEGAAREKFLSVFTSLTKDLKAAPDDSVLTRADG